MRLESRDVVIIMIQRRVIGGRLRAAARRQDDGIMIGRLKCDAATVIVLEVEMAVAATDIGALVLFLPGEIGGGAADARRGVRADDPGALAGFRAEQRQDPALDHRDRCDPAVRVRFEFRVRAFIHVEELVARARHRAARSDKHTLAGTDDLSVGPPLQLKASALEPDLGCLGENRHRRPCDQKCRRAGEFDQITPVTIGVAHGYVPRI